MDFGHDSMTTTHGDKMITRDLLIIDDGEYLIVEDPGEEMYLP